MFREAKIYVYSGKGWEQLKGIIEAKNDPNLIEFLAIYKLYSSNGQVPDKQCDYAILVKSDKAELIAMEFGATEVDKNNTIKHSMRQNSADLMYGNRAIAKTI